MSKGNMLLGYARGSVGDLVFARQKGQQITKARNRNPYNPKSDSQVIQRAKFSNSVKFFTRGVQNLFKFAFEGKDTTNSDFNAFMRYNQNRGCLISRYAFDEVTYPALGKFMMSKGSLPRANVLTDTEDDSVYMKLEGFVSDGVLGEVSTILRQDYQLMEGDIVTLLCIVAHGSDNNNTPTSTPQTRSNIEWTIKQFAIDSKSTQPMSEIFAGSSMDIRGNILQLTPSEPNLLTAGAVVFSRNTKNGLKVSTSILTMNVSASESFELTTEEGYIEECKESWKFEPVSILQGSITNEDPSMSKYTYDVFLDQDCNNRPTAGDRVNKLFLRVNKKMVYPQVAYDIGNVLSEWQNMRVDASDQETGVRSVRFYLYNRKFQSSLRGVTVYAGEVIALASSTQATIELGNNLITQFID